MSILARFGFQRSREPLSRFRVFALEQLISFHCSSGDIRWSVVALAADAVTAIWALGHAGLVRLVRNLVRRGKACFAAEIADADSMVAAGGG